MAIQIRNDNVVRNFQLSGNALVLDSGVIAQNADAVEGISPRQVLGRNSAGKYFAIDGGDILAADTSNPAPFVFNPADTLVLDVDNAGNATATFDAAAGYVVDTTSYAVTDQESKTLTLKVDDGWLQTITFGTATTAAHVIEDINAGIVGAHAIEDGGQVKIVSDTKGTGSTIEIVGGDTDLTFDTAVAGTGDVENIYAVSALEFKTVVEADTTAEVTVNSDGSVTVASPTTGTSGELEVVSGNCVTKAGLTAAVYTGGSLSMPKGVYVGPAISLAALQAADISNCKVIVGGTGTYAYDLFKLAGSATLDSYIEDYEVTIGDALIALGITPESVEHISMLENSDD